MSQDLRELFNEDKQKEYQMKTGHGDRFLERLDRNFPAQKRSYRSFWAIAASVAILLGIGIYFTASDSALPPANTTIVEKSDDAPQNSLSLGDLSPDLKRIEDYYVANINLQLSQLEISPDNKVLVDSYLEQLAVLNTEYSALNSELNQMGPNNQTIAALIKNLQLRLELLYGLEDKINELKSSENEQVKTNSI